MILISRPILFAAFSSLLRGTRVPRRDIVFGGLIPTDMQRLTALRVGTSFPDSSLDSTGLSSLPGRGEIPPRFTSPAEWCTPHLLSMRRQMAIPEILIPVPPHSYRHATPNGVRAGTKNEEHRTGNANRKPQIPNPLKICRIILFCVEDAQRIPKTSYREALRKIDCPKQHGTQCSVASFDFLAYDGRFFSKTKFSGESYFSLQLSFVAPKESW